LSRGLIAAGATLGAISLALLTASPAAAAPRPIADHDGLFAIDCDGSEPGTHLYSVDPLTAAQTLIGTGTIHNDGEDCALQPAWNAFNQTAYFILEDNIDGPLTWLATMDLSTGVSTLINPTFEGDDTYVRIDSMAITPAGDAYAWDGDAFFSMDLTNGHLTFIDNSAALSGPIWSFAADPTTGILYALTEDGDLYTINPGDAVATYVGFVDVDAADSGILSLQVDSAGILWFENDYFDEQGEDPSFHNELWTVLNDASAEENHGDFDLAYTEAILIVPGFYTPKLPATGVDATPLLAISAGIIALGGALVLLRRRTAQ
jgi:LPXTG-motif cell wall-anchored protein